MSLIWGIVVLLVLTILSAFFSGSETAITSMGRHRLKFLTKKHKKKKRGLATLLESPHKLITTILIANNFVNIMASSVATLLSLQLLPQLSRPQAGLVATLFLTTYILIFGEITPKNLAKNHSEKFTLAVINIIHLLSVLLTPFIKIFGLTSRYIIGIFGEEYSEREPIQVSEDQIKMLVYEGEERGLFDKDEGDMIRRIFAYDDLTSRQAMVPRTEVKALEISTSIEDARKFAAETGHSRLPVYEGEIDNVVGTLYAKDLLKFNDDREVQLKDLIKPAYYIPTTKPINDLFRDFKRDRQHQAVVIDEYGGMAGLITLEDVLEEIVGEIEDEYDKPTNLIKRISPDEFLVDPATEIDQINKTLKLNLPTDEGVTISGLILHRLEDIPKGGDMIKVDKATIEIAKASKKEIVELTIKVNNEKLSATRGEV